VWHLSSEAKGALLYSHRASSDSRPVFFFSALLSLLWYLFCFTFHRLTPTQQQRAPAITDVRARLYHASTTSTTTTPTGRAFAYTFPPHPLHPHTFPSGKTGIGELHSVDPAGSFCSAIFSLEYRYHTPQTPSSLLTGYCVPFLHTSYIPGDLSSLIFDPC